jgi:type II secretory pathway component PulJ
MRKKRSFTLLEIAIAIMILGWLLTGLFNCIFQSLKKNVDARELKQKVVQLELFQQRLRNLFTQFDAEGGLSSEQHPEAISVVLYAAYQQKADPDFEMCGMLQGMLFLNKKKELCLASWSATEKGRIEILLDRVDSFACKFFDPKKKDWVLSWSKKREEDPVMIQIDLKWEGDEIRFVFFLPQPNEQITYSGTL